ncbi:MAG: hypothetical protein Q7T55_16020, partial [Solirubrobacteraceae bacterium]|nr:hypothetical protein [Solirubrobacteraceae bacterium]
MEETISQLQARADEAEMTLESTLYDLESARSESDALRRELETRQQQQAAKMTKMDAARAQREEGHRKRLREKEETISRLQREASEAEATAESKSSDLGRTRLECVALHRVVTAKEEEQAQRESQHNAELRLKEETVTQMQEKANEATTRLESTLNDLKRARLESDALRRELESHGKQLEAKIAAMKAEREEREAEHQKGSMQSEESSRLMQQAMKDIQTRLESTSCALDSIRLERDALQRELEAYRQED